MATHNEQGKNGEQAAVNYLIGENYQILETNWRYKKIEIDIIAKKENLLIFIEVKTRKTEYFGLPEQFVTIKKQRSMALGAEQYCFENKIDNFEIRYDIISVIKNKTTKIVHIIDAFFPELDINTLVK